MALRDPATRNDGIVKRVAKVAAAVAVVILLLCGYVALTAGRELQRGRAALAGEALADLERNDVVAAKTHFRRARDHLASLPARVLRFVPVVRQNIDAVERVVSAVDPVLDAGLRLRASLDAIDDEGLVADGAIRVDAVRALRGPLRAEADALATFLHQARAARSGWLLPPLWDALDRLVVDYEGVVATARDADVLLGELDGLLGFERPRRYLVVLINNAELRGAGGILSGVGTLSFDRGRLRLGRFFPVEALRDRPYEAVRAPADYERFAPYKANTTLWVNATFSPDVPDVALVAARLFRKTTGTRTDGAIVIDPRGIGSLANPDAPVEVDELDVEVPPAQLADFVYSDVYARFEDQAQRRAALLGAGRKVFSDVVAEGLSGERLAAAADSLSGGHLRFISFADDEQAALDRLGVTGSLTARDGAPTVTVTSQNLGSANGEGTKLDYWAQREVAHVCDMRAEEVACTTSITIRNEAPVGLGEYVGGDPYGILRSYVEVYVPMNATIGQVTLNGDPVEVFVQDAGEQRAAGVFAHAERGETARVLVGYTIPAPAGPFEVHLRPQPLTRDARLVVGLGTPSGWVARGVGEGGRPRALEWDHTVTLRAEPDPRTGLSGLWAKLVRFWREPVW